MIDAEHDPDGIAFFTTGEHAQVGTSVFGASANDRLDALFGHVGTDEAALPADAPIPISHPASSPAPLTRGFADEYTAFVLGGPAAIAQVNSG